METKCRFDLTISVPVGCDSSEIGSNVAILCVPYAVFLLTHLPTNIIPAVRFEVFTAVTMKNGVFWVVTPCGSCAAKKYLYFFAAYVGC
jgi:hypothetical protein